jgi:hypothetical protein
MNPSSRHYGFPKVIGLAAFLGVTAVLLALVAHFTLNRRSTGREIASLESTRDRLQEMAERLTAEGEQAERDKRIVLDLLRNCRVAEDIPNLQCNRIVARHLGLEKLCVYVPKGSHSLEISSTWRPRGMQDPSTEVDGRAVAGAGEKTWNVPLFPASGYYLTFASDRKGGPIHWELKSNHPEFKTQAEAVPVDGFSHQGSSWSGSDVVQFPNQIERFSTDELEAKAKARSGVNLMNATLYGSRLDQQYEVVLNVRILSVGPACVSATEAQRVIILRREDLLLPYQGGGKYEIRSPIAQD